MRDDPPEPKICKWGLCIIPAFFVSTGAQNGFSSRVGKKKKNKTKTFSLFTKGGRKAQPLLLSDACGAPSLCG